MRAPASRLAAGMVLLVLAICLAPSFVSAQFSDVLAVKFNGSSQAVEAHVLDARADGASPPYKSFKLQVPTVFKDAAHSSFQHLVNIETGDLFAIKYNGASGFTEVHALPASSKYLKYSLQTATPLAPSSPGTFEFALGPNDDIYAVKLNGSGGFVEVHVLDASKNYKAFSKQVATALKAVKPNDFQFLVNPTSGDLTGVKFEGESSQTELHTLSAESDFSEYSLQTATGLEPTTRATWRFLWNADGDLVGVKFNGSSKHTEVHVLSRESSYKSFSLQQATVLEPSSTATFQFGIRGNLGLVAIKHLGASNSTEIHQLAATLKGYVLQTKTALPVTPDPNSLFQFTTNSKGDLYGIKFNGESGFTEIHGTSASSKYSEFTVQTATALPPSSAGSFAFFVDDKADLWAIKFEGASNTTEVHVLTSASAYKRFRLQTKTKLPVTTPGTWRLCINLRSGDLYGIKLNGSSKSVEVHVVSAASSYQSFSAQLPTTLAPVTPGEWDFAVDSSAPGELATVYGFKHNGASGTSEVHVLSAISQYKSWALQTATALPPSSPDTFQLLLIPAA